MAFFPAEPAATDFVSAVRACAARAVAIEFFDAGALHLLAGQKRINPAFEHVPDLPAGSEAAVYVEYAGASADEVEGAVAAMADALAESGGDMDQTWLADSATELERLKNFRHAVPEAVNLQIDQRRKQEPGLTKLGTDLAVPDGALEEVLALYHRGLAAERLEYVMFGHIGNNHLHVNIIPRTLEEYQRGKALYLDWARTVVRMGGTVSAEHGIGKLKTALLREMYGDAGIREMRALKALFDPQGMLNPGDLFG